jgi:O-antigen ligase
MKKILLQDVDSEVLNKKEKNLYFLLLFFFFSLYMPGISWLYNVSMWSLFMYSFFFNSISEKWALLKKRKEIIIMILFFLINFLSAVVSENKKYGIALVGFRISLIIVPIAIGTLCIKNILKERLIFGFAVATTCAAVLSLLWSSWLATQSSDWSLMYNDNLSKVLNLQSIYFAMMINLAIFSFVYLLLKRSSLINKSILLPAVLFLLVVHFLLASRIAIIILYSSIFIFAIVHIVTKKKLLEGVTLIMGLLLAGFLLVKFFPKTINRFKELTYTKFDYGSTARESHFNTPLTADQWNGANIRIAVWQCTWAAIKNNIVFGTGLGDKMEHLKKQYAEKGFTFGITTNRNVHNSYLDVWLSLGLLGLIIFVFGFFLIPIFHCVETSDWYGLIIIISFMFSLFPETYLDRTFGNTILAFFISFITSYKSCRKITPEYPVY